MANYADSSSPFFHPPDHDTTTTRLQPTVKFAQLLRLSPEPNNDVDLSRPFASHSDTDEEDDGDDDDGDETRSISPAGSNPCYPARLISSSDVIMSPCSHPAANLPYVKSPWIKLSPPPQNPAHGSHTQTGLIATLLREEGHVYSLAASGNMLYTGSDARNIAVWKNFKDFGGFKSSSGLVKAIVVLPPATTATTTSSKIFSGHRDGRIRVWNASHESPSGHKRIGTLPRFRDYLKSSINPNTYVRVRPHRKVPRVKHLDAVSCLGFNIEAGLLYSGSWDKTIKVWRLSDSKCLESVHDAHDDAINSVVVGFDGVLFSGSADGTLKAWRRELQGRSIRHFYVQTLLTQQNAVTALAVKHESGSVLYSGSSDGLVNFWDLQRGRTLFAYGGVLRGHKLPVLCLATAGSTLVLSGSADNSVCVWKREEAAGGVHLCLAVLTGHSGPVKCLGVDHADNVDGERKSWVVYSGSLDKSVKVWRVHENMAQQA